MSNMTSLVFFFFNSKSNIKTRLSADRETGLKTEKRAGDDCEVQDSDATKNIEQCCYLTLSVHLRLVIILGWPQLFAVGPLNK